MGWLSNIGGFFSGSNQKDAANAAAAQLQQGKNEAIGYLNPWSQAGGSALAPLTGLLTGNSYDYASGKTTALSQNQRNDLFQASPGYQFRLDQAMKALTQNQNAHGYSMSGGAAKELTQYSQNIASDEYSNYLNQLFQLAGIGQQADAGKANAAIGVAAPLASAAYSAGISQDLGASRILNTGASIGGAIMGTGGFGGSGASASPGFTSTGGGQYNSAMMMQSMQGGL